MDVKTIVAIGLVVFIIGALILLKTPPRKKKRPRAAVRRGPHEVF